MQQNILNYPILPRNLRYQYWNFVILILSLKQKKNLNPDYSLLALKYSALKAKGDSILLGASCQKQKFPTLNHFLALKLVMLEVSLSGVINFLKSFRRRTIKNRCMQMCHLTKKPNACKIWP